MKHCTTALHKVQMHPLPSYQGYPSSTLLQELLHSPAGMALLALPDQCNPRESCMDTGCEHHEGSQSNSLHL